MPRYFFHIDDGVELQDDDGETLPGFEVAKCHAVQLIAETLWKSPHQFWQSEVYRVTVTDDRHLALFSVQMIATLSPAVGFRSEGRCEA